MVSKVVLVLVFWILKSSRSRANAGICSEQKCNLSIDRNNPQIEFLSKSSEDGVRMVYLHLNIGNESYNPLHSYDKFLPSRWTWARDIGEPMLSFSYQYEVLSLGLLRNQVRNMKVMLNEEPGGCFADLNSSCKDVAVARTLLDKVIDPSGSPLRSANVVCVSVVQRDMDWLTAWYYGNVVYHCCKRDKRQNETVLQCALPVKYSDWLRVFYHELTFGVIAAFFFWPAAFVLLPDFVFKFDDQQDTKSAKSDQKSSPSTQKESLNELAVEIPIDDESPITLATFINKCIEHCPTTSNFFKLFCLCYVLIPIFGYIFFALNYIFLLDFLKEIEAKHAIQENFFFHYIFDIRSKPYCLIPVVIFFVIPGNFIYFVASKSTEINDLRSVLCTNLQGLPKQIINLECIDKKWISKLDVFFGPNRVIKGILGYLKTYKILFYFISSILIFIYVLMLVFCAVYGVVFGVILVLVFLVRCAIDTIKLSPFIVLMKFIKKAIEKALPRYFFMPFWIGWVLYFSLAVSMCCRFFIRMFGFVLMGLIINAHRTTPYVIFIYVLISNISTSYKSFQERYKDVKDIIFRFYKKRASSPQNAKHTRKAIPKDLFWEICNVREILPIHQEICIMLISMLIIASTLFLALATIVFFGEEYNSSPLISAAAVLLSGKIPDLVLQGLIKRDTFKGWEKIRKEEEVRKAVDAWMDSRQGNTAVTEKATVDVGWI